MPRSLGGSLSVGMRSAENNKTEIGCIERLSRMIGGGSVKICPDEMIDQYR